MSSQKYGVNQFLISAIISKVTNVGQDLNTTGLMVCGHNKTCFGLMRVPTDKIDGLNDILRSGPNSAESIEVGIKWLLQTANCICQATLPIDRETLQGVTEISKYRQLMFFLYFFYTNFFQR